MALVGDLTTAQLNALLAVDFNTLYATMTKVLSRVHDANDAEIAETLSLKASMLQLKEIILASGNTAAATAYAVLHP